MPLRDHFRSPVNDKHRWDAVHGGWPMEIVRTLFDLLPEQYTAEPLVRHDAPFEVDVSMIEDHDRDSQVGSDRRGGTATLTATAPTLTIPTDLTELDEYEIQVYDNSRERRLVAAIELVSPANKDRPDTRDQFLGKVGALLRQEVCVAIVDIVTVPQANLYADLLGRVDRSKSPHATPMSPLYAATLRLRTPAKGRPMLDAWYLPMALGEPLPTIPLWLSPELRIELPLEPSYQEVCRLMRIK